MGLNYLAGKTGQVKKKDYHNYTHDKRAKELISQNI